GLRALTAPLRGRPVTLRRLGVGGAKPVPFLPFPVEPNPSLGRRGVRLLLEDPQLVRTQLAALFRLAQEQDVRILVPMVTLEEDIREMRVLFDATLETFPGAKRPPFGAMIETPAAALGVATIARHVDFLSVGTNDLTQYTLAAGRDDPAVSQYYDDTHAAVLRLLAIAIADAPGVPITSPMPPSCGFWRSPSPTRPACRSRCAASWQGARKRCRNFSGSASVRSAWPRG